MLSGKRHVVSGSNHHGTKHVLEDGTIFNGVAYAVENAVENAVEYAVACAVA